MAHRGTRYLINERGQQDFESEARRFPRLFQDIKSIPGLTHPDICYDGMMILDIGNREVQLHWLGRAHTEGRYGGMVAGRSRPVHWRPGRGECRAILR